MMIHLALHTQSGHRIKQSHNDRMTRPQNDKAISYWSSRCSGGAKSPKQVFAQPEKLTQLVRLP